jgi:hypothetical protein
MEEDRTKVGRYCATECVSIVQINLRQYNRKGKALFNYYNFLKEVTDVKNRSYWLQYC